MTKLITLLILLAGFAVAQTPDCVRTFQFTTAGQITTLGDNRQTGCVYWFVGYQSSGFSAISLVFQSATGGTSVGAFGNYTGTVNTGSNPATNTTGGSATFTGYVGWYQMTLASATGTGTVTGALYGYKNGFSLSLASSVTISGPITVQQSTPASLQSQVTGPAANGSAVSGNPVLFGGSDGTNVRNIKVDASGNVQVVVASALPTGANTIGAVNINGTVPVSGTFFQATQPVSIAATVPVSIAATQQTQGAGAAGSAVTGNPFLQAGSDGANARTIRTDANGYQFVTGPDANAAAPTGNPVLLAGLSGGATGGLVRTITVCPSSAVGTVTAGNTTQAIALVAGQTIRICSFALDMSLT